MFAGQLSGSEQNNNSMCLHQSCSYICIVFILDYFWMLDPSDNCEKEHVAIQIYPPTPTPQEFALSPFSALCWALNRVGFVHIRLRFLASQSLHTRGLTHWDKLYRPSTAQLNCGQNCNKVNEAIKRNYSL